MIKVFIFLCISIQLFSNRNFYQVIFSYGSKFGGTGWHRAKLIDVAVSHFGEWWFAGYGNQDPGWGHYFGMTWTDVTNEYILAGIRYGIAGVLVLCWVLYVAFSLLRAAYKKENQPYMKTVYWSLGSMSVDFFGQLIPIFYCMLGIMGASVMFQKDKKAKIHNKNVVQKTKNAVCGTTLQI